MRRVRVAVGVCAALIAASGCGDAEARPGLPTPTGTTVSSTPTETAAPPAATATGTAPSTATQSSTSVATATATPTRTATLAPPAIVAFGVARPDDAVQTPGGFDAEGRPIYTRAQGQGMVLFVEAERGGAPLNVSAYDPDGAPVGIEFLVSRPLGDGSLAVCDQQPPLIGGVPAVNPPHFSEDPEVLAAIADLGCRVNDGTGNPLGRNAAAACTRDLGAVYNFTDARSDLQYCLPIARPWGFAPGDTVVAARVRDLRGNVSAVREIVVRIEGDTPFGCGDGLGERVFTIGRPDQSAVLVSTAPSDVSRDPWAADPLRLCAGPDLGGNVHGLTLREDARLGIPLADGSTVCAKILARGSDGTLDCGGSTAHDVRATQAVDGMSRIMVDTGLGISAGAGAASLRADVALVQLPVGSSAADCAAATFTLQFQAVLTTATGTAEILSEGGAPLVSLSHAGVNFSCLAWRDGQSGTFVLPVPAANTLAGDVAVILRLGE